MVRLLKKLMLAVGMLSSSLAAASALQDLMRQCVPHIHPVTMKALVRAESMGSIYAISDDGPGHLPYSQRKNMLRSFQPASKQEALEIMNRLEEGGHWFGVGLTQISSRNIKRLGLTSEQALDPCTNLKYGGQVLTELYQQALKTYKDPEIALNAAVSAFNTGSFQGGFKNGYVDKVLDHAQYEVPALKVGRAPKRPVATGSAVVRTAAAKAKATRSKQTYATSSREQGVLAAKFAKLEVESY